MNYSVDWDGPGERDRDPEDQGHKWDIISDFCMGCGMARATFHEQPWMTACPNDDSVTYRRARFQIDVLVRPILEKLGLIESESKQ
jgi:hypothetical protein